MFSRNEVEKGKVDKIIPFLSDKGQTAVGENDLSSILEQSYAYTSTRSVNPPFKGCGDLASQRKHNIVFREDDVMDDNKLLEMYMEKVDKDQRELREDMREREARIGKQIADSESRENERMNRIEQLILNQNDKIDSLKNEVSNKLEDDKKYRHTNNIAIVLGVVTTVVALVGIYYATVSMVTDIIGVAVK